MKDKKILYLTFAVFILCSLFFGTKTAKAHQFTFFAGQNNGGLVVNVWCANSPGHPLANNYDFFWGDGVSITGDPNGQELHQYAFAGTYTISCISNDSLGAALEVAEIQVSVASRTFDFGWSQVPNTLTVNYTPTLNGAAPPANTIWSRDYDGDGNIDGNTSPPHQFTFSAPSPPNYSTNFRATFPNFVINQWHEGVPTTMIPGQVYERINSVTVAAIAGSFTAAPNQLLFGSVNIGSSNTLNLALTGTGGITVNSIPTITGINAAQFSHNWGFALPTTLDAVAKNFQVTFTPQAPVASKSAVLNFDTSAGAKTVNLEGTAAAAGCGGYPTACTVANQNAVCCSQVCSINKCAGKVDFVGQVGGVPCGGQCTGPAPLVVTYVQGTVPGFAETGFDGWLWDIPGGTTPNPTSGPNPPITGITVTYANPGIYSASLTVAGGYSNSKDRSAYINVTGPASTAPKAIFSMLNAGNPVPPTVVNLGDTLNFTDSSTCFGAPAPCAANNVITASEWNFDDGTIIPCLPSCAPSHQFNNPGLHNITLSVTDGDNETNTSTQQIDVQGGPPITGSITINNGDAVTTSPNVQLDFTCAIAGVACDATDWARISNTLADLAAALPQTYTSFLDPWVLAAGPDGQRAVFVQFSDDGISWSSIFGDDIILSTSGPTACFNVTVNNFQVSFDSSCSTPGGSPPITLWEWSFGDGQTLNGNFPTTLHTYAAPEGNRTATLIVTDSLGVKSAPFSKTFFVGPPKLDFTLDFPNLLNATTTEELIDGIITWLAWIIIPLAVLLIIYAAFRYMIAGAIPAERVKAIQIIQYALIGIVVVILAKVIKGLIEFLLD